MIRKTLRKKNFREYAGDVKRGSLYTHRRNLVTSPVRLTELVKKVAHMTGDLHRSTAGSKAD